MLARIDWGLIAVFILMFIDLRLLAHLSPVRDAMRLADLAQAEELFMGSALTSQFISNVPAAILLAEYIHAIGKPSLMASTSAGSALLSARSPI
ncbi:MAG: hypothetical protein ACR2FI_12425 [Burkholderiales bacterium]|nr:hypothetical protein [Burkholderiales bacterium]MDQ3194899.1 hypothetical protein [Pseudomonadota bacterium]